jgi:H+/Cl- antiporter ClcA
MIDPQARPAAYLKLQAFVGLITALITFVVMALVHQGTTLIWEQGAATTGIDLRVFTLLVCTIGGLLVGLSVKVAGDQSGIFAEVMLEFGKTGRFDDRNAPGIVLTACVSLVAGARFGPEAPLADASGGLDALKAHESAVFTDFDGRIRSG